MLSASYAFRRAIADNSKVLLKATLSLADGTLKLLSGDDFMMGGTSFTQASSSSGAFHIGSAVIGSANFKLNNYDGRFDELDFTGATIEPEVGVELENGTEWVAKGVYRVEQPSTYGTIITLSCTDNLSLFQSAYTDANIRYPMTARALVEELCRQQGVRLLWEGGNDDIRIEAAPYDPDITCLDAIGYIAQITCNFVLCDPQGRVVFRWYGDSDVAPESSLDGGILDEGTPYNTGDNAEGGTFLDYSSGDYFEGGEFGLSPFVYLKAFSSLEIGTDDVVVTGVSVTACDEMVEDGENGETYLEGSEGYVLSIERNPFIPWGDAERVAKRVGDAVVGMRFRAFTGSAVGDPTVEPGDRAFVWDALEHGYFTYITSLVYRVGGYESFSCEAEAPARNSACKASASTKAYRDAKRLVERETYARKLALDSLAGQLAESSGLYMSKLEQADGSTVYYMHDKPTLPESKIVWKLTADAMGVSTDGGKTYPYGFDVSGQAVLDRIYAIGIDASYINTGTLDASEVQIENLMRIGDGVNGVSIDKESVRIEADNNQALSVGVVPYTWVTKSFTNGGGKLVPSSANTSGEGRQWARYKFPFDGGHIYMDENRAVSWSLSVTGYYDGQVFHIAKSGSTILEPFQTNPFPGYICGGEETFGEVKDFGAGTTEPWMTLSFRAYSTATTQEDIAPSLFLALCDKNNYITAFKLSMKQVGVNGEITSQDETFLTDKNFTALANGGELWSGVISIPFFYNNIARNYNLYFQDGLLKEFNLLTPTDDGFSDH